MKIYRIAILLIILGLLGAACDQQPQQVATTDPYANNAQVANIAPEEWDYWAKDNFDLLRIGPLIERSRNTQEFESYLNSRDGINNLDLNGDGYVDYLSVDEYSDCNEFECGWSIYDRFGPDRGQEIATVVFYRDEPRYSGARVLITGNDNLYGDNYYYETNWLDVTLNVVSALFSPRRQMYRSAYYYDYYPPDYVVYEVVETPLYVSRIERLYPEPVFVFTSTPSFIDRIKIKSPNNGLHLGQIKARLVKPSKEQAEFVKNNAGRARVENPGKGPKTETPPRGSDRGKEMGKGPDGQRPGDPGKPDKADNPNKGGGNPNKGGNPNQGGDNPNKGGNPDKGGNPNKGGDQGKGKGKKP
jgi:hypothetical protein